MYTFVYCCAPAKPCIYFCYSPLQCITGQKLLWSPCNMEMLCSKYMHILCTFVVKADQAGRKWNGLVYAKHWSKVSSHCNQYETCFAEGQAQHSFFLQFYEIREKHSNPETVSVKIYPLPNDKIERIIIVSKAHQLSNTLKIYHSKGVKHKAISLTI